MKLGRDRLFKSVDKSTLLAPLGLIIMIVVFSITADNFFLGSNLKNILKQSSINMIIAAGMTVVILTGGIDLSVGSLAALAACTMAQLYHQQAMNAWIAAIVSVLLVTIIGAFSGVLIAFGRIPPFIMTLGMMQIARGIALIITSGYPSMGFDEGFRQISRGEVAGIPIMFLIAAVVMLILALVLKYSPTGRHFFAIGGNEEATRLSGINIRTVKITAYAIAGLCAGIAAMVLTARVNSASPSSGDGYEMNAIAAVVLGGTSLSGGEGSIIGTIIGAFVIAVLNNGLSLLNVDTYVQMAIIGAVIVATVLVKNVGENNVG